MFGDSNGMRRSTVDGLAFLEKPIFNEKNRLTHHAYDPAGELTGYTRDARRGDTWAILLLAPLRQRRRKREKKCSPSIRNSGSDEGFLGRLSLCWCRNHAPNRASIWGRASY